MVLVDPQSPPSYASALSMSNVKVSPPTTPEKLSHGGAPTLSPSTTTSSIYTVEQPHAEEQPTAFCVPGSGSLEGWLHKKHAHAKMLGSQWAKRYAFIHEERGLLIISKKPDKTKPFWHKDHTCFPLADVTSITQDDERQDQAHCFALVCNHERLVLRAESSIERERWMEGLQQLQRKLAPS